MIGEVQAVIRMLAKSGITMMIVTHEMDFARKIASRVLFMDEGGIDEEGTPKEIFEHPQKPNTIKFIKRLTSLTYKIETVDYDFTEAYDELQQYAEKLLIENERISDLQIALEEIVVNNVMEMTDEPQVLAVSTIQKSSICSLSASAIAASIMTRRIRTMNCSWKCLRSRPPMCSTKSLNRLLAFTIT